jgi:phosphatidylglycerophosphate synthase
MSKLTKETKFLDFSDYGRHPAAYFTKLLVNTSVSSIHITYLFGISGLLAIYCILNNSFWWAAIFLVLKSILDAMDGSLARLKQRPSYVGRYLDSIFDILLNFLLIFTIAYVSQYGYLWALLAFLCIQFQGTLYNFYYVILRNKTAGGDATSQIFETQAPVAFPYENQKTVNIMYSIYSILYGVFDRTIYALDRKANRQTSFPNWFMSVLSLYGLGFQLLIVSVFLALGFIQYIIPFFIVYTFLLFVLVGIRKSVL